MITRFSFGNKYPTKRLGELVHFLDNMRRPVTEADRKPGPYPYYGANGQQGVINSYLFDEPLVLLAEDGGHFDSPERGIAYRIAGKTWVNNHAHVLRPTPLVDIDYLCRVLENYDVRPWVTGTTRGKLTKAGASDIEIPLPPLPEQRRIAAILDKADALRAKRREAIAKLDQLLQSVFLDMFGDPVTNPKGWPMGKVGDMLESTAYGTSAKAEARGDVPVLRMNNITYSGEMDLTALKYISFDEAEREKYAVEPGDLLFNRTNSKELVGKTAVYVGPTPMTFAGYLVRGRTKAGHCSEYISAYLNSPWGKKTLQGMCKSIVGMANINAREFCGISLPIPLQSQQSRFTAVARAIRAHKSEHVKHLDLLDLTFSSLQQRAFSDQL